MERLYRFNSAVGVELRQMVRARPFWFALCATLLASALSFPARGAHYLSLVVLTENAQHAAGLLRGAYGSAWVGLSTGMLMAILLSIAGFFLIRGALARDIETNVWRLLVTTPMTRFHYLLAKWCGSMVVLTLLYLLACAVGILAIVVRAEASGVRIADFAWPYLYFCMPAIAFSASAALAFDLLVELRHTAGNIVFALLAAVLLNTAALFDWLGFDALQAVAKDALAPLMAGARVDRINFLIGPLLDLEPAVVAVPVLHPAASLSVHALLGRAAWLALALLMLLVCARFLDRAAARPDGASVAFDTKRGAALRWLDSLLQPLQRSQRGMLAGVELAYILRTRAPWWWPLMGAAWAAQAVAPLTAPADKVPLAALAVVAAWLAMLDIFSRTVLREAQTGTGSLIFPTVAAGRTLLPVRWLVLAGLACLGALPLLLRCLTASPQVLWNVLVLVMAIPSVGMALGAVTRGPKLFEIGACVLAYLTYENLHLIDVLGMSEGQRLGLLASGALALALLVPAWRRLRAGARWSG